MDESNVCSGSAWEEDVVSIDNSCIECGKILTSFSNLCKHVRKVHNVADSAKIDCRKCLICPICNAELISKKFYEEHLLSEHDTKLDKIDLEFPSEEVFSEWKETIERKNSCMYVKRSGMKNGIRYLYCHRSGEYKKSGTGKRKLKKKGSNKIHKTCPSKLKVTYRDDMVNVEYIKTHLGHSFDVERMKINEEERKSIAEKLASRMTIRQVLNSIEKPPSGKIEPIHTLTRKDIHNIGMEFKIPIAKEPKGEKASRKKKNTDSNVIYVHSIVEVEHTEMVNDSCENNSVQSKSTQTDSLITLWKD